MRAIFRLSLSFGPSCNAGSGEGPEVCAIAGANRSSQESSRLRLSRRPIMKLVRGA